MSWRDEASCVGKPPQWWLGDTTYVLELGIAVCQECPSRVACLVEQVATEERLGVVMHGVYGGATAAQRRRVVQRRRRVMV